MTIYEFKRAYYEANPYGHFFDRKTMKFFGDTMRSFRAYKNGSGWKVVRVIGRHHEWYFSDDFKLEH